MYEYPPILSGSAYKQLAQLRDYLVRMVQSMDNAETGNVGATLALTRGRGQASPLPNTGANMDNVSALRSLIVKTAHTIEQNVERLSETLHEDYLALSDFGSYAENLEAEFTATARGIVEEYKFESRLDYAEQELGRLESHMSLMEGQIRRGLITDPDTGEQVFGIAISQKLSFTGNVLEEGGLEWYELSPGQTLGLYTSTGWQFWINGSRRGWFDSADGMLHVRSVGVEQQLQLGGDWLLSHSGGFGIRYMG